MYLYNICIHMYVSLYYDIYYNEKIKYLSSINLSNSSL